MNDRTADAASKNKVILKTGGGNARNETQRNEQSAAKINESTVSKQSQKSILALALFTELGYLYGLDGKINVEK